MACLLLCSHVHQLLGKYSRKSRCIHRNLLRTVILTIPAVKHRNEVWHERLSACALPSTKQGHTAMVLLPWLLLSADGRCAGRLQADREQIRKAWGLTSSSGGGDLRPQLCAFFGHWASLCHTGTEDCPKHMKLTVAALQHLPLFAQPWTTLKGRVRHRPWMAEPFISPLSFTSQDRAKGCLLKGCPERFWRSRRRCPRSRPHTRRHEPCLRESTPTLRVPGVDALAAPPGFLLADPELRLPSFIRA